MKPKTAIVFLHGFMGSPRQFDRLLEVLGPVEADTLCLTLPSHGGTLADFVEAGRKDWQRWTLEQISDLANRYDRLVLVGHSMGGLLLIQAASEAPEKITAVAALAVPLKVRLTFRAVSVRLRSLSAPKPGEDPAVTAARDLCGVSGLSVDGAWRLLPNTIGLLRLVAEARREVSRLLMPLLTVHSQADEIVSVRSAQAARDWGREVEALVLSSASHFWYPQEELEQIAGRLRAML